MKRLVSIFILVFFVISSQAQNMKLKENQGGIFSLGLRTSMNIFDNNSLGVKSFGYGGQFRLQLANRLNTEWFLDYNRSNIEQIGNRTDYHIGWSVMYYFTDKIAPPVKPYIVAGHCFDKTIVQDNLDRTNKITKNSSAIQAGAGVHFNLTERLDITFVAQYMFHLGKDVHVHVENNKLELHKHQGTGIEGHLLLNVGINFKIVDLWAAGKKKK